MNDQFTHDIQQKVLARVHRGEVQVRPRIYFVLRIAALITLALLALVLSAFVLSFIAFSIHESGEDLLLGFGGRGIFTFITLFPWVELLLDILVVLALEWVLQGFRFGYRVSLATLFGTVLAGSAVLAVAFYFAPVHSLLLDRADQGELPFLGDIYEQVHDSHADQGVFRGTVTSIQGNTIIISHDDHDHDVDDGTRTVALPPNHPPLSVGDKVYVFGSPNGQEVRADGVGRLPPRH